MHKSQPHLAGTPPPDFLLDNHPHSSKDMTSGSRPKSLFAGSVGERRLPNVRPERPSSYAPTDDFDRRPLTPPNREFRRLGVLPSPTIDASSSNFNDRLHLTSNNTSVESSVKDDLTPVPESAGAPRTGFITPHGTEHANTGLSPSRTSSVDGDAQLSSERLAEVRSSAPNSRYGDSRIPATDDLETPKQDDYPGQFAQAEATTSPSLTPQHEQYREEVPKLEPPRAPSPSHSPNPPLLPVSDHRISGVSQIPSEASINSAGPNPAIAPEGPASSIDGRGESRDILQNGNEPTVTHGQDVPSKYQDHGISDPVDATMSVEAAQVSPPQRETSTSAMSSSEQSSHLQTEPRVSAENSPTGRSISPLLLVSGSTGTEAAVAASSSDTSKRKNSDLSTINEMPRYSNAGDQAGAGLFSKGRHSRSLEVSPQRSYDRVSESSASINPPQNESSQMQEPPVNQYQTPAQAEARPFSFIQYSTQEPAPSQDRGFSEQAQKSDQQNPRATANYGNSSSERHQEQSASHRPAHGYTSMPSLTDEKPRHLVTENGQHNPPNQHHHSASWSSQDPNIREHPAYRQGEPPTTQDPPSHYYPAETRREENILPRQSGTEYQLTGVGPPPPEPVRQKSRQSSRGSGFFRRASGNGSTRPDVPTIPAGQRPPTTPSRKSTENGKKLSKRGSIFRPFTRDGSESDRSQESMVAHAPGSRTDLLRPSGPLQPSPLENRISEERRSNAKGLRGKLQRLSMSGAAETNTGKTERFPFLKVQFMFLSRGSCHLLT